MKFTMCECTAEHVNDVEDLMWKVYKKQHPKATRPVIREIIEDSRLCFCAFTQKMIGYVLIKADQNGRLHIFSLGVQESCHRNCVAKELLKAVEKRSRKGQRYVIDLHVPENNEADRKFFGTLGYKCIRIVRRFYGDDNAWQMRKVIHAPCDNKKFVYANEVPIEGPESEIPTNEEKEDNSDSGEYSENHSEEDEGVRYLE